MFKKTTLFGQMEKGRVGEAIFFGVKSECSQVEDMSSHSKTDTMFVHLS